MVLMALSQGVSVETGLLPSGDEHALVVSFFLFLYSLDLYMITSKDFVFPLDFMLLYKQNRLEQVFGIKLMLYISP